MCVILLSLTLKSSLTCTAALVPHETGGRLDAAVPHTEWNKLLSELPALNWRESEDPSG